MDLLYGHDRKLGDFEDPDMTDMLEPDMFQSSSMGMDYTMDQDWLNSLFADDPVLNDRMMTEAVQSPCIKSEHSYSIANDHNPASPLPLAKMEETDTDLFAHKTSVIDLHPQESQLLPTAFAVTQPIIKTELPEADHFFTNSPTITTAPAIRPSTIILATSNLQTTAAFTYQSSQPLFPTNVQIKEEPVDTYETLQEQTVSLDSLILPPTPPSSTNSDSDGSQSPQRSAPNSPQRQSPLPHSGVLILTEEEKRTLISEGYPIPSKLPLSKLEEKNLKKVRRKIKNKISAQESRRKKKEYLEALEKRVEAFNHENTDLKKKVETLENNNRSLLGQLQKLQALVGRMPRPSAASATQTGTVLMVLALCFAVFLGGLNPTSFNIGYSVPAPPSLAIQQPSVLRAQPNMGPGVVHAQDTSNAYSTPSLKSRVLMSLSREDAECDDYRPLVPWQQDESCPTDAALEYEEEEIQVGQMTKPNTGTIIPSLPASEKLPKGISVVTIAFDAELNATQEVIDQATMHPDIAVSPNMGQFINYTVELETA